MSLTKAVIWRSDNPSDRLECRFNPTEYSVARTNAWQPKGTTGKDVPQLTFTQGGGRTMSVELFFDVFETPGADVRDHVNKLWTFTQIDARYKNVKTKKSRPPLVVFQWGPQFSFRAAITSLSVRYTLFRQDGAPVRATASVSLQEAEDEKDAPAQNPTSGSEAGHKRHLVRPHDSLPLIAYQEYGDATRWRCIAEANGMDDPTDLPPGRILSIPPVS